MGLDSVELVLTFEEVFQISILNEEAEKMRTPRDVIDCMVAKLEAQVHGPAMVMMAREEAAWVQLRNALRTSAMVSEAATKEKKLEDVFADRHARRRQWRQLRQQLQAKAWPGLSWLGLGKDFPCQLRTLGDLSDWIARCNLQRLTEAERQVLTRADIALLVKHITLQQTGLREEKYDENKHFVDDFGID
ncbi:hypothetical protein [Prosthecobacter sp.]|uniref:hypothetical protein n=1 Tax=Prosthecobacter sp. TaxID=1965333 RepID=UPI0037837D38